MGLSFCCPSCGATLRVTAATAPLVSCPGCGEPIRVPRRPHPVESRPDDSPISSAALFSAAAGVSRLRLSLLLFAIALGFAAAALAVRLANAPLVPGAIPDWLPAITFSCVVGWVLAGWLGCWARHSGYKLCRPAAAAVGVEPWAKAAGAGTWLCGCGMVAAGVLLIGMPRAMLAAAVLIGLTVGLFGVALEFAILTVWYRLLWETAGWRVANGASRYTLDFVFAAVAVMGCLCLGGMTAIGVAGGHERVPGEIPASVKWVFVITLAAVAGCVGWTLVRYARLLAETLRALRQPEPNRDEQVPTET
jgi:hypothetical protein